jgi:hypothetical protein
LSFTSHSLLDWEIIMFKLSSFTHAALGATLCASLLAPAPAAWAATINNGDFSGGLAGWVTAGNVAADGASAYGPPAGGLGAADSTSFLFGGSVVNAAAMDAFTGMPAGSMAGFGGVVGSALAQSFNSGAGDTLTFSWKFMTNEPQNSPSNDRAFVVLDGVMSTLTTVQAAVLVGFSASPLLDETAYASFTLSGLSAGSHKLVFGIMDVPDSLGASVLAVTGVDVTAVPEPGSWALLLAGMAVVGGLQGRRNKSR